MLCNLSEKKSKVKINNIVSDNKPDMPIIELDNQCNPHLNNYIIEEEAKKSIIYTNFIRLKLYLL